MQDDGERIEFCGDKEVSDMADRFAERLSDLAEGRDLSDEERKLLEKILERDKEYRVKRAQALSVLELREQLGHQGGVPADLVPVRWVCGGQEALGYMTRELGKRLNIMPDKEWLARVHALLRGRKLTDEQARELDFVIRGCRDRDALGYR